jgi:alkanesulfonate monooxygenase SsuD/methylene tetrahydromethanopterin reductase-like flavin-dependent oxidoreductase (luciferase family)
MLNLNSFFDERVIGILTGNRSPLGPPFEFSNEFRNIIQQPAVQQMTKYALIGSKETVKKKIKAFIENTGVDELIAVTNVFDFEDRRKSVRLFAEIMKELNGGF